MIELDHLVKHTHSPTHSPLHDSLNLADSLPTWLRALLLTGPAELREQLRPLGMAALVGACARLRPGVDLADSRQAVKAALRCLARRHQQLSGETRELDAELSVLVTAAAPDLLELPGVGVQTAGQLLTTAGDNPDRLRSDAAFVRLCGTAPIPASSGRTDRHQLNRVRRPVGQLRPTHHRPVPHALAPAPRMYVARRRQRGLFTKEIMRCLKRLIARQIIDVLRRIDVIRAAQLSLPVAHD